ncbi:MAG: CHAD domain-containing protein [Acidobacteria bacterium]|nr:CHAD domain-containing protein [Acidobacteriota bacterium]
MKKMKFKWDETESVTSNVRTQLTRASRAYFEAGRDAVRAGAAPADLHAFRLRTKRFRYTLELFEPLYGPAFERMIRSLRRIQQLLGDINDCVTARKLVEENGNGRSPQVRRVLRTLDRRQGERIAELAQTWPEFDRAGACERWLKYLAAHSGRAAPEPARRSRSARP